MALTQLSEAPVVSGELAEVLRQADPGILLAILVQLTGDETYLDLYEGAIDFTFDSPEWRGRTSITTQTDLVNDLVAVLKDRQSDLMPWSDEVSPEAWRPDVARRIFALGIGEPIADEYIAMLREQGGFVGFQTTTPRTRPLPSRTRLAIIGAGLSGVTAAIFAQRDGVDFEIYDRNADVGGTWYEQTYPGVGVDTPSAYYSLAAELNPDWTSYYPKGGEYNEYLKRVVDERGIRDHIQFSTEVESMHWDEAEAQWVLKIISNGEHRHVTATHVIAGTGFLNRPKLPDWEGRDDFVGTSLHAARWLPDLDMSGKRVAVVGTGCTAVQIVDAVVDDVSELIVVQRQPHWVGPRKQLNDDVPTDDKLLLRTLPLFANWRRLKAFWGSADKNFPVVLADPNWMKTHLSISPANDTLLQVCLGYIDAQFGDRPELAAKVTPNFPPFAKRIIRDPGRYYEALTYPHVRVEAGGVQRVVSDGLVLNDGSVVEVDVIIYATGFTVDYLSEMEIRGRDGITLAEEWDDNPMAYRGGTVPGFPNFFLTCAPNTGAAHGGGHNFSVDVALHYAFECIQMTAERGATAIEVTRDAYREYVERIDRQMANTVWGNSPSANTYYRNSKGRVTIASPFPMVDIWHEHRVPRPEHLVFHGADDSPTKG